MLGALFMSEQNRQREKLVETVSAQLIRISESERDAIIQTIQMADDTYRESLAQEIYNKSYDDRSSSQVLSETFITKYNGQMSQMGELLLEQSFAFKEIYFKHGGVGRDPSGAAELLNSQVRILSKAF